MRLMLTLAVVLLLSIFMMACGEDDDSSRGVAYPRICLLMAPGAQHAAITRVAISVTARDMDTEEFDLDISDDGKTATGALSVTSGSNRLFTVTVYSADGVEGSGEELVAFLEPGTEVLLEINISDTSGSEDYEVVLVGWIDTPGRAYSVHVSGNYAYVADSSAGLRVIDISDPANPNEVGFYHDPRQGIPEHARKVHVSGDYAYVADSAWNAATGYTNAGLRVVDISTPANPNEVGFRNTPDMAYGVYVSGDYAYVAGKSRGLRVMDVSTPVNPREIATLDGPSDTVEVYVSGNYAYAVYHRAGFGVIDVSDPGNPLKMGSCGTRDRAIGVHVLGDYAYVADTNSGLLVIDVSNPANPREVGFYDTPGQAYGVYVVGQHAYVAALGAGLRVIDISDPANPREVGFYTLDDTMDVYVSGGYIYVADGNGGLRIFVFR